MQSVAPIICACIDDKCHCHYLFNDGVVVKGRRSRGLTAGKECVSEYLQMRDVNHVCDCVIIGVRYPVRYRYKVR